MGIRTTLTAALGVSIFAGIIACQQLVSSDTREPELAQKVSASSAPSQGRELFDLHCAVCHGSEGRGDGAAAPFLFPPVRDFAKGFRLVSTDNGTPSEADLVATLKRGMPGSAMPSWSWLGSRDLKGLATYVRELATLGLADDLGYRGENGERLSEPEAFAEAKQKMMPGAPLRSPTQVADLERGRALYLESCSTCHNEDGTGSPAPLWNDSNELNWARDFTAGFMKGSASAEAIACRIQAGMPGSAMPSTSFEDPQDLANLVAYVRSLIPEGSDYRLVHRRQRITVKRVAAPLPNDPKHLDWHNASEVLIALSPLWWQEGSVVQASVSALHDGESFAVRFRWRDEVGGPSTLGNTPLPDAVAIQFSEDTAPPLFGMGSHAVPTTIWHWKSQRAIETAGTWDLLSHFGNGSGASQSDASQYRFITEGDEHSKQVNQLDSEGVDNVSKSEHTAGGVRVITNWDQGEWEVIFIRSLAAPDAEGFSAQLGSRIQVACSIWNGEAADVGGHKSISIWHELEFER